MSLLDPGSTAQLIRDIDRKWSADHEVRRIELGRLRDAYMSEYMARRLATLPEYSATPAKELRKRAEDILSKAGASSSAPENEKRTALEERMVGAAKVMWHKLIKAEGVAPPRAWSKDRKGQTQSSGILFRQLSDEAMTSEKGRLLVGDYIAHHALQLLKICERAKNMNPQFVSKQVRLHLAQLLAASTNTADG